MNYNVPKYLIILCMLFNFTASFQAYSQTLLFISPIDAKNEQISHQKIEKISNIKIKNMDSVTFAKNTIWHFQRLKVKTDQDRFHFINEQLIETMEENLSKQKKAMPIDALRIASEAYASFSEKGIPELSPVWLFFFKAILLKDTFAAQQYLFWINNLGQSYVLKSKSLQMFKKLMEDAVLKNKTHQKVEILFENELLKNGDCKVEINGYQPKANQKLWILQGSQVRIGQYCYDGSYKVSNLVTISASSSASQILTNNLNKAGSIAINIPTSQAHLYALQNETNLSCVTEGSVLEQDSATLFRSSCYGQESSQWHNLSAESEQTFGSSSDSVPQNHITTLLGQRIPDPKPKWGLNLTYLWPWGALTKSSMFSSAHDGKMTHLIQPLKGIGILFQEHDLSLELNTGLGTRVSTAQYSDLQKTSAQSAQTWNEPWLHAKVTYAWSLPFIHSQEPAGINSPPLFAIGNLFFTYHTPISIGVFRTFKPRASPFYQEQTALTLGIGGNISAEYERIVLQLECQPSVYLYQKNSYFIATHLKVQRYF